MPRRWTNRWTESQASLPSVDVDKSSRIAGHRDLLVPQSKQGDLPVMAPRGDVLGVAQGGAAGMMDVSTWLTALICCFKLHDGLSKALIEHFLSIYLRWNPYF